jgi:hypothetical protein
VVDPEDHRLGQLDAQDLVEVLHRGQAGPEGFSIATASAARSLAAARAGMTDGSRPTARHLVDNSCACAGPSPAGDEALGVTETGHSQSKRPGWALAGRVL